MEETKNAVQNKINLTWTQDMTTTLVVAIGLIIALFIYTPEAWGSYTILIPMIFMSRIKEEANIRWKVSKKYTIIAYTVISTYCVIALQIGTYLTSR